MNYRAFIKQVSGLGTIANHDLSLQQSIVIGREPSSCQIVLDSNNYQGVSRRHVEIRPLASPSNNGTPVWQVCDLGSANGTFVNGQPLNGCHTLQVGDRIILGKNGPEFIFECVVTKPTNPIASNPIPLVTASQDNLSITQLFPLISTNKDLLKKAYLIPGVVTVLLVVGLFASIGNPVIFNGLLALYIITGCYYFIYQLAGKYKPWWLMVLSALTTIIVLLSPLLTLFIIVFRYILPGQIPEGDDVGFIPLFITMFFGAGLMEELIKAIPVFIALWVGRLLKSPWREKIGVWEPLDAILLATASGAGFTILETLGQYVPGTVQSVTAQAGEGVGELVGIQLLIPRILGSIAGHMAYSGYFGYFIGLSVMKPSKRWQILAVGYLSASVLHAFWNASGAIHRGVTVIAGILGYVFLVAAILKGREISPNRAENFATRIIPPKF